MRELIAWVGLGAGIWLLDSAIKGKAPLQTLGSLLTNSTGSSPTSVPSPPDPGRVPMGNGTYAS